MTELPETDWGDEMARRREQSIEGSIPGPREAGKELLSPVKMAGENYPD